MPRLEWIGKDKVVNHHREVPFYTLEHKYGFKDGEQSETLYTGSGNKIIHGDNLAALKSLMPEYEGRVNCIYIDPPYNTGEEKWVYNDNVNDPHIRKWLHQVVGKPEEDFSRDDKWLCMMYPRLQLLQKLLHPDGAIFISIDDNEYENLKCICDEIFGHNCFVANISWQRTYSPRNDKGGIAVEVEHLLVYSKKPDWKPNKLERTDEMDARYKSPDGDAKLWKNSDASGPGAINHQGMVYGIQHPLNGKILYPSQGRHWSLGQDQMFSIMNEWADYELRPIDDFNIRQRICGTENVPENIGAIMLKDVEQGKEQALKRYEQGSWPLLYFSGDGKSGIRKKTYLANVEGRLATNFWPYSEVGHTDEAKKELKEIFNGHCPFDTPKPTRLIKRILDIATDEDSIVLDSFAGSGSTGHAVLQKNQEDHGNRKFILVELMDYADTLTATRVKRVITGYPSKMKHDVVVYNKKLTIKNLKNVGQYLAEAEKAIETAKVDFAEVNKPKIVDNSIRVTASRVEDKRVNGIAGAFDYYELGEPIFKDDLSLNEAVGDDALRKFVYYTETHQYLTRQRTDEAKYLLDTWQHTGYYFYYEKNKITELDMDALSIVTEKADLYIIYADVCLLSKKFMADNHIIFKKIPRDIKRF